MLRKLGAALIAAGLIAATSPSANALTLCQLNARDCPRYSPHIPKPRPTSYLPAPRPNGGFGGFHRGR
jgi:hypothetical protein